LKYLGDIPHGDRQDRAEGLTLDEENKSILVVYDSPTKARLISADRDPAIGVYADIFQIE
jgi:hypothetical protein